jgi:mono/diheme cytochrome c family protein
MMRSIRIIGSLILTLLIVTPLLSLARAREFSTAPQKGENIFRAKCSVCHGVDGGGQTENGKKLKVPDLRSEKVQSLTEEEMLDSVMNGKGYMPPMGKKYSADQLKQVVVYVRSLGRKS